jgi:integration host factor subunit alpha
MKTISRNNTHKKNIALNINHTIGIPLSYAAKIIDDLISILISNVLTKNQLKIKNFGVFNLKKKNKRIGRNPKNKTNHEILERNVLTFKSAIVLSRKVNNDTKK